MSIVIQDLEGVDHTVNLAWHGGSILMSIRTLNEAVFDAMALDMGLKVYTNPAIAEVLDEDGEIVQAAVEASGPIKDGRDITVVKMGQYELTPAVLNDDGTVQTAATYDTRFHGNVLLGPSVVARGLWKQQAILWSSYGADVTEKNAVEEGKKLYDIELLDPESISSPSNVFQ